MNNYFFFLLLLMGSCVHAEKCGGIAGISCKGDLICQPDDPSVVDGFGTCVEGEKP